MASFNTTLDTYKILLANLEAGRLKLPNRNLDVGDLTRLGAYPGADQAYASLLGKLADRHFAGVCKDLRSNIVMYYAGGTEPIHSKSRKAAKKERAEWKKLMDELMQLQAEESAESASALP